MDISEELQKLVAMCQTLPPAIAIPIIDQIEVVNQSILKLLYEIAEKGKSIETGVEDLRLDYIYKSFDLDVTTKELNAVKLELDEQNGSSQ